MITIGKLAKQFGMLPSQVYIQANTYDLMINDVLATYENYQQMKSSGKIDHTIYKYTQEELINMMTKSNE